MDPLDEAKTDPLSSDSEAADMAGLERAERTYNENLSARSARRIIMDAVVKDIQESPLDPNARGVVLWRWLSKHPQPQWSTLISTAKPEALDSLVLHLCMKGYAPMTIADKLGLSPLKVQSVWRENSELVGESVMGVTLPQIIGRIEARCDAFVEQAIRSGRPDRAWNFERQRIGILQDLGIVERAAKRHEHLVQHRMTQDGASDDKTIARDAEIQRLVELREMRSRSTERAQRLVSTKVDAIPVGTHPLDEEDDG